MIAHFKEIRTDDEILVAKVLEGIVDRAYKKLTWTQTDSIFLYNIDYKKALRYLKKLEGHTLLSPNRGCIETKKGFFIYHNYDSHALDHTFFLYWAGISKDPIYKEAIKTLESFTVEPEPEVIDPSIVDFFFLYPNRGEINTMDRELKCPSWAEIKNNYPMPIRKGIEKIDINSAAKLWILQGEPGTGKTHVIRALARKWVEKDWETYVLMDPKTLLESDTLLAGFIEQVNTLNSLIVIEDIPVSFLSQREGDSTSTMFSKLLNLTDGLIGQGLNLKFLVTTNEPIEKLDPAMIRPGRMGANIVFRDFTAKEASKWLDKKIDRNMSLAEMYKLKG